MKWLKENLQLNLVELPKKEERDVHAFLDTIKKNISKNATMLILYVDEDEMFSATTGLNAGEANFLLDRYKRFLLTE